MLMLILMLMLMLKLMLTLIPMLTTVGDIGRLWKTFGDFECLWATLAKFGQLCLKKHVNEAMENTMSLIFIRCLIDCFHPDPPPLV